MLRAHLWLPALAILAAGMSLPAVARSSAPALPALHTPAARHTAWQRPVLRRPQTVRLGPQAENLKLDPRRDYILRCPAGQLDLPWTLSVWGGRNVVLSGCDLHVIHNWVAAFKDQTGTLWLHDVHFGGSRLTGGIQLQEPAATVVMRDVLFDTVHGSYHTNHAELVQSWAGPRRLLIDGLTGATTYQGLFLEPDQFTGAVARTFDLRHIYIDDSRGGYALWLGDLRRPLAHWHLSDVWVRPHPGRTWLGWWSWPQPRDGRSRWSGVHVGVPPAGGFVRPSAGGASGIDETVLPPVFSGEL